MLKAYVSTLLKITISFLFIISFSSILKSQCPNIQLVDMRGIAGYPNTEYLNMCGEADTLSVLIFTDEPGTIQGFQLELNLLTGMEFAGFADSQNPNATLTVIDSSATNPKFLLETIGSENAVIANIGVKAVCGADITSINYFPSFNYSYTFTDTLGNVFPCKGSDVWDLDMNNAIKKPVLNFSAHQNLTANSVGTMRCRDIYVSQNGLSAKLDSFRFYVSDFDWNDWGVDLNAVYAGVNTSGAAVNYTSSVEYNADSTEFSVLFDGPAFAGQGTTNDNNDTVFDEDEELRIQVCFTLNECPDFQGESNIPIRYKASWGCGGERCEEQQVNTTFLSTISDDPEPMATSSLIRPLEICSQTAQIQMNLSSSVADPIGGAFHNLTFGYETCYQPNLDVVAVSIGGTALPVANFDWVNDDIIIDLTTLTFDPDGTGVGIDDLDGDGFYDDLPGGTSITALIELDITCGVTVPEASSLDCPEIDCNFAQAFISANRNCNESYTSTLPVTGFDLKRGPTSKSLDEADLGGGVFGYAFPVETSDGLTTAWGTHDAPGTVDVQFCYQLEEVNVTGCTNDDTKLQITMDGAEWMRLDQQIISATFDDGSGPSAATYSKINIGFQSTFIIDAGSNATGINMCYDLTIQMDSCICSPETFTIGTFQVVETCSDCSPTCDNVLVCDKTNFSANASCEDCPCPLEVIVTETRRVNYGYTDKTMTTQLDYTTADPMDLNRYIPGDTIWIETATVVNDPSVLPDLTFLQWRWQTTNGTAYSQMRTKELVLDAIEGEILSFSVKKAGSSTRTEIDVNSWNYGKIYSGYETCHPIDFSGSTPWDGVYTDQLSGNGINSSVDYQDGVRPTFSLTNVTNKINCGFECDYPGDVVTELINEINWEQGDTIFIQVQFPMIKNSWLVAAEETVNGNIQIHPQVQWSLKDIANSNCQGPQESGCYVSKPIEVYCPGGVKAKTILSLDNCGGEMRHVFEMTNLPPADWYVNEYRPYIDILNVEIPLDENLVYCGNAKATDCLGTSYDIELDSTINMNCINNEAYCAVASGTFGTILFDPSGLPTTVLGFGLNGSVNDSLVITHDICYLCPDGLEDYNTYNLSFDWKSRVHDIDNSSYACGVQTSSWTLSECFQKGDDWYDLYELDTLYYKVDQVGEIFIVDPDNRTPLAALTSTITPGGVLTSTSPGTSVEMQTFEVCVDGSDLTKPSHTGVIASITLTPSVALASVSNSGNPVSFTLTNSSPTGNTYAVNLPDLDPADCYTLDIGTTLLYCPVAPDPSPNICVNVTSGCMDFDVQAALLGNTTSCSTTEECFSYSFAPAEIQAEWILPTTTDQYGLCDEVEFAILVKNVRTTTIYNMLLEWDLPLQGLEIVPGSFEYSWPNDGDMGLPFTAATADPTTTDNITYAYTEDAIWGPNIHADGLEGINTATTDGNKFVIKFKARTTCDEFVSGSTLDFEALSSDPCSSDELTTGAVSSNAVVIAGADPAENALILNFAAPETVYCGGGSTQFSIAGLNISDYPTGDSVIMCVNFPTGVTYVPNSLLYVIPSGQALGNVTTTTVGSYVQLCFDGPVNLGPDQQYAISLEAIIDPTLVCGDVELGVDIKTVIESQSCSTQTEDCAVLVQNSLNDGIFIEVAPPIETLNMEVYQGCNPTTGNTEICYEIELRNTAPTTYNSFIQLDILDDLQANAIVDASDPVLGTFTHNPVSIPTDGTVIITGCIEVQNDMACPILLNQTFDAMCECENTSRMITDLPPQVIAENDILVTCPSEPVSFELCGNYTYSFSDPNAVTVVENGDIVQVTLNDGYGISAPETITITGGAGSCSDSWELLLESVDDLAFEKSSEELCEGTCLRLDLDIPANILFGATVNWIPTTGMDNPSSFTPEICGLTGDVQYIAEITLSGGCIIKDTIDIDHKTVPTIPSAEEITFCVNYEDANLTASTGYATYEWYQVLGGNEVLVATTTTNTYTTNQGGTFIYRAYDGVDICYLAAGTFDVIDKSCYDWGDLPDTGTGTNTDNYETFNSNSGPSHLIIPGLHLGAIVDTEDDGQQSSDALGDGVDEDGIPFPSSMQIVPGGILNLPFSATNTTGQTAYFEMWIDWNGDGDFLDANEMVVNIDDTTGFPTQLNILVPSLIAVGQEVGVRLRLSNTDEMTPYGEIGSGEVEDYLLAINCETNICVPATVIVRKN